MLQRQEKSKRRRRCNSRGCIASTHLVLKNNRVKEASLIFMVQHHGEKKDVESL